MERVNVFNNEDENENDDGEGDENVGDDNNVSMVGRKQLFSKSKRMSFEDDANSLFSTLLQTGEYPVAVCRLLSDMMESNPSESGKGTHNNNNNDNNSVSSFNSSFNSSFHSSFNESSFSSLASDREGNHRTIHNSNGGGSGNGVPSLDEVIQDLEEMSNNPHVFLYDQCNDFYCSNLQLGQGHYGRVKELTTLREISNRSEQEVGTRTSSQDVTSNVTSNVVDVVFVSGPAGSGKSRLVQQLTNSLSSDSKPWMVLKVKFKRSLEYESREIVSSLFDNLVSNIARMKDGDSDLDAHYARRASAAVSDVLDPTSRSSLAKFVPSIKRLVPDDDDDVVDDDGNKNKCAPSDYSRSTTEATPGDDWQLVFLLSKLLGAILTLDRRVFVCLDDLQWCDSTTIRLVVETLISASQIRHRPPPPPSSLRRRRRRSSRLLVVGMYRDDEIVNSHPLTLQLAVLRKSPTIDVTEIELSSLSREDIADMIATEVRLSRRLVSGLADVVHRRTSGHALFVVQLLNSLVRDSVIAYSPRKRRFDWDENRMASLRMGDSVASLIVSNLSRLRSGERRSLMILSCFGVQSDLSLVKLIDGSPNIKPKQGRTIESFLPALIEGGILELSGLLIAFSHDLIQQHVYDTIPDEERYQLHLDIGIYLGTMTLLDADTLKSSLDGGVDQLYLSDASSTDDSVAKPSTLVSIVTDQINAAGPSFVTDESQRIRFASWNLHAGKDAAEHSNFRAALFNYENGIAFLADMPWGPGDGDGDVVDDEDSAGFRTCCRELHEGAAFSSLALGEPGKVERYARTIIENVPFEDSLVAQALHVKSLLGAARYAETIATGLAVLRLLKFDVPSAPTPMAVYRTMIETGNVTSKYTSDQITNLKQTSINARKRNILKIVDGVVLACYRESSPYLPLVACAMVKYSLQNGVCEESATAFVVYGYFKIFVQENFEEGRRWGDIALKILDSNLAFTPMTLYGFLLFWFIPHQKVANVLIDTYEAGMSVGDVDGAMYALCVSMRFSFFGGVNLSLLSQSYVKALKQMVKFCKESAKFAIVDLLIIQGLTGVDYFAFSVFEGMIQDEDVLLANAKLKKHRQVLEIIYSRRFFSAFWFGEFAEANKWYDQSLTFPSMKMPKIQLIYHTFYRGIIAYQMYRDGEGEEWLDEGKKALDRMEVWSKKASKAIFENKLYLLEAEHYASNCNIVAAKESYELSAKSARDHGVVHEQGLAYELYGKFLSSVSELDASDWFERAHGCYIQWGAAAKAAQLRNDYNLGVPDESTSATFDLNLGSIKHSRDEDGGLI